MADYTPAGEIRSKIHELIGNPDAVKKTKQDRHKYYRRPGKGHNRDHCDACGDTGDIVCCDECPASFHLLCLDPPLEEDGLPNGGWTCRACSSLKRDRQTGVVPFISAADFGASNPDVESYYVARVFSMITERIRRHNPLQFLPPKSVATYEQFLPGTSRRVGKRFKLRKEAGIVEVDPKTSKIRAVLCYHCEIGTRVGPMIQCDFCRKHFHLDCLEPPMTSIPAVLWICPLHPQPLMESKHLDASGPVERVRIWDLSNQPVVASVIKIDFVAKTHAPGPIKTVQLNKKSRLVPPSNITEIYGGFRNPAREEKTTTISLEALCASCNVPHTPQIPVITLEPNVETSAGLNLLLQAVEVKVQGDVLDNCLKHVHPDMIKLLAAQKLAENPRMSLALMGRSQAPSTTSTRQKEQNTPEPLIGTKRKQAPAVSESSTKRIRLTPTLTLVHLNDGTILEYQRRSLEVGTGGGVTLDLSKLGSCVVVSKRHASIYYDQTTGRWELLNYGDAGTIVNGMLYGIDTSHYDSKPKVQDDAMRHFKQLVDQRKKTVISQKNPKENLTVLSKQGNCLCSSEEDIKPGECWEGCAAIQKGDTIQFGCHKFVVVNTGHVEDVASIGPLG